MGSDLRLLFGVDAEIGFGGLATSVIPKQYALVLLQQLMEGKYLKKM